MGRRREKWTIDKIDKLNELLSQDLSREEISRMFGVSVNNLNFTIHKYKVETKNKGKIKEMKQTETDLATRIRILKGELLREEAPKFAFADDQIKRWLNGVEGCVLFCKEVLNVELQDYQVEMVKNMINHKRNVFLLGRQSGKDFLTACYVLWLCIVNSNEKVLLVSPAQRQSDLLFNRILSHVAKNNELFDSVSKSNMESLEFTNNSKIKNLPSTTYIRGESEVTLCIMNEARDFMNGEEVMASILPMLAVSKGSLVIMSSASGCSGILWDCFNNPLFVKMQLPSSVNKYIDKDWLNEQKQILSSNFYQMEFEAQFSEAIDNFFSVLVIQKCSQSYGFVHFPNPELKYYLGVDWGRTKDSSVLTVVSVNSDGIKKIENIIELFNKPFTIQLETIKNLHNTYNFTKIISEKAGLSLPLCENLKEEGLPVEDFIPTVDSKAEAFNYLLREMENEKVIIPTHPQLQYELRTFRFEVTPQGKMKLHHASEYGGDDFVDSLCFAIWATEESGGVKILSEETIKKWNDFCDAGSSSVIDYDIPIPF